LFSGIIAIIFIWLLYRLLIFIAIIFILIDGVLATLVFFSVEPFVRVYLVQQIFLTFELGIIFTSFIIIISVVFAVILRIARIAAFHSFVSIFFICHLPIVSSSVIHIIIGRVLFLAPIFPQQIAFFYLPLLLTFEKSDL
jgi:hypothetical protein